MIIVWTTMCQSPTLLCKPLCGPATASITEEHKFLLGFALCPFAEEEATIMNGWVGIAKVVSVHTRYYIVHIWPN